MSTDKPGLRPPSRLSKLKPPSTQQSGRLESTIAQSARAAGLSNNEANSHATNVSASLRTSRQTSNTSSSSGKTPISRPTSKSTEFKVGDEVAIPGNKHGRIMFLGETKFAEGVWAGVFLKDPIGKNDGSVNGIYYFKCDPLHGMFIRPAKLNRVDSGDTKSTVASKNKLNRSESNSSGESGVSTLRSSATTPRPSTPGPTPSSLAKKKCFTPLPTRLSNEFEINELKLGETVFISGKKQGIVRFVGPTDFSEGIWVGVELSDTNGKNNGSVDGRVYFTCAENRGLFAPIAKVSREPGTGSRPSSAMAESMRKLSIFDPNHAQMGRRTPGVNRDRHGGSNSSLGSSLSSSSLLYNHQLNDSEGREDYLRQQLDEADKSKMEAIKSLERKQSEIENLNFKLEELTFERADLLADKMQYQKKANDFEAALTASNAELNEQRQRFFELEFKLQEMAIESESVGPLELEAMKKKIETLQSELAHVSSVKNSLSNQLETCTQNISELTEQNSLLIESEAHLKFKVKESLNTSQCALNESDELQESLKASQNEVSILKSRIETLSRDKDQLQNDMKKLLCSGNNTSQQLKIINEQIEDKSSRIDSLDEALKSEKLAFAQLKLDEEKLRTQSSKKIQELEEVISNVQSSSQEQMEALQNKYQQNIMELNSLQCTLKETKELLCKKDNEIESVKNENDLAKRHVKTMEENMTISDNKFLKVANDLKLLNIEYAKFKNEFTQVKLENDSLRHLQKQNESLQNDNQTLHSELGEVRNVVKLHETENSALKEKISQQSLQIETLMATSTRIEEENTRLKESLSLAQDRIAATKSLDEKVVQLKSQLENEQSSRKALTEKLASKESEIKDLKAGVKHLKKISQENSELILSLEKAKGDLMDRESRLLEVRGQLSKLKAEYDVLRQKTGDTEDSDSRSNGLIQERDSLSRQVEFLNSVIADLQNKLELANDKIYSLENNESNLSPMNGDISSDYESPYKYKDRLPPRLWCDFCDCFDLHDTDDCPSQQATDSPPPSRHKGSRTIERPYCESCEVFGHWTHDCDDEETF